MPEWMEILNFVAFFKIWNKESEKTNGWPGRINLE